MIEMLMKLSNLLRRRQSDLAPAEMLHVDAPMWVKAMHLQRGDVVVLRAEASEGLTPWAKELNARTGAMVLILGEGAELEGALRDETIQRWQETR